MSLGDSERITLESQVETPTNDLQPETPRRENASVKRAHNPYMHPPKKVEGVAQRRQNSGTKAPKLVEELNIPEYSPERRSNFSKKSPKTLENSERIELPNQRRENSGLKSPEMKPDQHREAAGKTAPPQAKNPKREDRSIMAPQVIVEQPMFIKEKLIHEQPVMFEQPVI